MLLFVGLNLVSFIFLNHKWGPYTDTEQLYSKEGRTREQYTDIRYLFSFDRQLLRFLLRKAKLELPLAGTIDICLEKANLLSIWMPRYYASGTSFRISRTNYRIYGEDFLDPVA